MSGLQGANNSATAVAGADAMCILADHTADLSGAACMADGIDNFNGMAGFAPVAAPDTFVASGSPWPMGEITDTASF